MSLMSVNYFILADKMLRPARKALLNFIISRHKRCRRDIHLFNKGRPHCRVYGDPPEPALDISSAEERKFGAIAVWASVSDVGYVRKELNIYRTRNETV